MRKLLSCLLLLGLWLPSLVGCSGSADSQSSAQPLSSEEIHQSAKRKKMRDMQESQSEKQKSASPVQKQK